MFEMKSKKGLRHYTVLLLFVVLLVPGWLGCMEEDSGSQLDIHLPVCDGNWTSTVSCRPLTDGSDSGFANYWDPSRLFHADWLDAPAEIEKNKPFLVVLTTTLGSLPGPSAVQCMVWIDSSSRTVFLHPVISWGYPSSDLSVISSISACCVVEGLRFPGDWEIRYTPEDEKAVEGWGELPRATITVLEN